MLYYKYKCIEGNRSHFFFLHHNYIKPAKTYRAQSNHSIYSAYITIKDHLEKKHFGMHRSIHQSCYNHLKRENGTLLNIHRLGKFF